MFEKVKNMLVNDLQINPDDIKPEAELINDLGINSLELADLILLCEEKFGLEVKDDDIHKFITVGDVVAYLEENVK
ncbi:MAG: acyl carrier protein [Clostridia bacterium]|nr:acyl carrier protein [Clostridia bacterium]